MDFGSIKLINNNYCFCSKDPWTVVGKNMLDRITDNWERLTAYTQTRWRWLGYLLVAAALVYIGYILIFNAPQIHDIPWKAFWIASLITLGLYLLSLLAQYFIWTRMLSFHRDISIQDLIIFFKVLVLRRLPGGVWHWVGRTALYSGLTEVPAKAILMASFMEWMLLVLTACTIAILGLNGVPLALKIIGFLLTFGLAIFIATRWKSNTRKSGARLGESILWICIYAFSWVLGGLVIFAFVRAAGGLDITWLQAIWIWAVTGGSSLLVIIVPTGLGIREIALVLLLQPYLQAADALIVAMMVRLTFTFADLLWGLVGVGLGILISSRKKTISPSS
jgi:hypothetical protein